MKYLLDSNICIHFLRGNFDIDKKLEAVGLNNCYISEITLVEFERIKNIKIENWVVRNK